MVIKNLKIYYPNMSDYTDTFKMLMTSLIYKKKKKKKKKNKETIFLSPCKLMCTKVLRLFFFFFLKFNLNNIIIRLQTLSLF